MIQNYNSATSVKYIVIEINYVNIYYYVIISAVAMDTI
jgi:hypothetical protein